MEKGSLNAEQCKISQYQQKTLEALEAFQAEATELNLWKAIIAFEGAEFTTSGRGSRPGVKFKYEVSKEVGKGGRHYNGESVDGYGNELWIITSEGRKQKSISRSTVELGFKNAQSLGGVVKGPKVLNVPGAHSYLYPIFVRFGIINTEQGSRES